MLTELKQRLPKIMAVKVADPHAAHRILRRLFPEHGVLHDAGFRDASGLEAKR